MPSTPAQQLRRRRFEAAIGLAAPVLDLVLAAGERVSRIAGSNEDVLSAVRPASDALELRSIGAARPPAPDEPTVE